jgi:hypothetical protein
MPLERFIPKSPDPFIRNSQDFEVAKFGHLNTIIEYVNTYVVTDSLQLSGTGPLSATARYITDSLGTNSSLAISTGNIGVGTTTPGAALEIYGGADTLGISGPANQAKSIQIARYNNSSFQSHYIGDDGDAFFGAGLTISASGSGSQIYLQVSAPGRNVNIGTAGQTLLTKDMGARLGVRGSGTTSATTAFLVQNSAGTQTLSVSDDRKVYIGTTGYFLPDTQSTTLYNFYNKIVLSSTEASNIVKVLLANDTHSFLSTNSGVYGKVGINTTTPTDTLAINGASTSTFGITLIDGVNDRGRFWAGNGGTYLNGYNNGLFLGTYSISTAVKIDYLGNVGIGITSQTARLHVQGSGSTSVTTSLLVQNSAGTQLLKVTDDGGMNIGGSGTAGECILSGYNVVSFKLNDTANSKTLSIYKNAGSNYIIDSNSDTRLSYGWSGNYFWRLNGQTKSMAMSSTTSDPTADVSAIVDFQSTTKGFLSPRMTTTQKNAIVTPAEGLVVMDITTHKLCCYNGTTWNDLF